MSAGFDGQPGAGTAREARQVRRVLLASMVGTTVEWYDFLVYASAASLVFGSLFFSALGSSAGLLASFATLGVSIVVRPIGALLAGHLGDRVGRKPALVVTLLLMGVSTVGVGLLPTYAAIGVAAPILLVVLRLLQGLSAGGEWGGAALMSVEHAPHGRRGYYGSFPQLGVPIGLLLANAVFFGVTETTTTPQFLAWGWRVPFLVSVVLIAVGFVVRSRVAESPVFDRLHRDRARRSAPLGELMARHRRPLLVATGLFVANTMVGYILIAFITSYGTGVLRLPGTTMLVVGMAGAVSWGVFTLLGGRWADRYGRRRTYLVGTAALLVWPFPFFMLLDTASPGWMVFAVLVLGVGLGLTYGPQAATYAEMFPAGVRYSGASFAYGFGAVLGGAFTPLISEWLVEATGSSLAVSAYMTVAGLVTLVAVFALRERPAPERDAFVDGHDEIEPPGPVATPVAGS